MGKRECRLSSHLASSAALGWSKLPPRTEGSRRADPSRTSDLARPKSVGRELRGVAVSTCFIFKRHLSTGASFFYLASTGKLFYIQCHVSILFELDCISWSLEERLAASLRLHQVCMADGHQDCEFTPWQEWSGCSSECNGFQAPTRVCVVFADVV